MSLLVRRDLVEGLDGRRQVGEATAGRLGEALRTERGHRERRVGPLAGRERGPFVAGVVLSPEGQDPVEGVVEAVALLRRWHAERLEHRLLETAAEADQEPPPGELVEGRDLRCDLLRRMQGKQEGGRAEAQPLGDCGVAGQFDERRRADPGLEMHLREPDRVQREFFGESHPTAIRGGLVRAMGPPQRQAQGGLLEAPRATCHASVDQQAVGGNGGAHAAHGIPATSLEKPAPRGVDGEGRKGRELQPLFGKTRRIRPESELICCTLGDSLPFSPSAGARRSSPPGRSGRSCGYCSSLEAEPNPKRNAVGPPRPAGDLFWRETT